MNAWSAVFAGDVHLRTDPGADWISPELRAFLAQHQVVSCNFEGVLDTRAPAALKAGPNVRQCAQAAQRVLDAGFNVVSLANNHSMDFGAQGLAETLSAFSGRALCLGAALQHQAAYAPQWLTVAGTRVALMAFGEHEFGVSRDAGQAGFAWVNHPQVEEYIRSAKQQCDVLLVQVHAGVEEEDLPLPEWRARYRQLLDAGADAVLAHHPHQPQGMELHSGKPIVYSLGNFCFDASHTTAWWDRGVLAQLRFDAARLVDVQLVPVQRSGQMQLCHSARVAESLTRLSRQLDEPAYSEQVELMARRLWWTRYRDYHQRAVNGVDEHTSWRSLLRVVAKRLLAPGRLRPSTPMLLHNLSIESHRWVVERALRAELVSAQGGPQQSPATLS